MPQIEAGACGKPVVGIKAMAMLDTLVHEQTALLAGVAQEVRIGEAILGEESGFEDGHRVVFDNFRTADYRASVYDIADHLLRLMEDADLRRQLGQNARKRVVENYDYRVVARKFCDILGEALGIQ